MDKKIILTEEFLDQSISLAIRSLVGEQMKRFEILSDLEQLKKECKELAYEKERELKAVLKAFNSGVKFIYASPTHK